MDLKAKIRNIPDFPEKGVMFRDITTLIGDGEAYAHIIDCFVDKIRPLGVDKIVVLDARGFLIGPPVAYALKKGLVPVRKAGKLPYKTYKVHYELEYGSDMFELHVDAVEKGTKVAVLDDLLATGGTAKAACDLIEMAGGEVAYLGFVIELSEFNGKEKLKGYNVESLAVY